MKRIAFDDYLVVNDVGSCVILLSKS